MAKLKKVLKKRRGEFSSYRNCWLFHVSLSAMLIGKRKAKRTRSGLIPQPLARIGLAQQSKVLHFRGRFVACCGGIRANGCGITAVSLVLLILRRDFKNKL